MSSPVKAKKPTSGGLLDALSPARQHLAKNESSAAKKQRRLLYDGPPTPDDHMSLSEKAAREGSSIYLYIPYAYLYIYIYELYFKTKHDYIININIIFCVCMF